MRIVVNNQPKGNLDFIMRPISLKLYIFTGYEVQASKRLFKELDSSLRWNDDASEAWTPNPIDRFRTASIASCETNTTPGKPAFHILAASACCSTAKEKSYIFS
jgi:hypothetical protein